MKEKLEILMSDTSLRVGEIAAKLGVKPAVISHILKGRNQPNFVLTGKIISTFKEYNPYWWLGCSDEKFLSSNISAQPKENSELDFFSEEKQNREIEATQTLFSEQSENLKKFENITPLSSSQVERVIVIYSDQTFETFTPKK